MKIYVLILFFVVSLFSACTSKQKHDEKGDDKKTIVIAVTKKPTYPDMIKYAIEPELKKRGYTVKLHEFDESIIMFDALISGEVDLVIAGHRAAYNFLETRTGKKIETLVTVPSAHIGLFSQTLKAKTPDELKSQLKPGDVLIMPDDPTNLPRSLIFLERLGFLKLKDGIDKFESNEKDIVGNPYKLSFKVLSAAQIPRNLNTVAAGVVFGDDADLLGILNTAIAREIEPDERFLILFGLKPGNGSKKWAKVFKEVVESESFRNVIEDTTYRFHKYYRPAWYRNKWGIKNEINRSVNRVL